MSTRPPQGTAKIKYWGGLERSKDKPSVLVYDDGSTNPAGQKPVWRKKMSPADVVKASDAGLMFPLNAHPKCANSRAATFEELATLAKGMISSDVIKLDAGRGTGTAIVKLQATAGRDFPWSQDPKEDRFKVEPVELSVKWLDGEIERASATFHTGDTKYIVWANGAGNVGLSMNGEEISPRAICSNEDEYAMWLEWWLFRRHRMSYSDFTIQLNRLHIYPFINHSALRARVDRAIQVHVRRGITAPPVPARKNAVIAKPDTMVPRTTEIMELVPEEVR